MNNRPHLYIDISNKNIKEQLYQRLAEDLSLPCIFIGQQTYRSSSDAADIIVTEHIETVMTADESVVKILLSDSLNKVDPEIIKKCFSALNIYSNVEDIYGEIKRAYAYLQTVTQNKNAIFSEVPEEKEHSSLEIIAKNLSARLQQLMRQAEIRISLIDQLPVGVLGIDDEETIVLINPEAIDMLGLKNVPVWGIKADRIFPRSVMKYIKDKTKKSISVTHKDKNFRLIKNEFIIDEKFAGIILVIVPEPEEDIYKIKEGTDSDCREEQ